VDWLPSSVELNHAINWLWKQQQGALGAVGSENDAVAAAGIELLKQKRAGRATFLPLNKIQPQRFSPTIALRYADGFIDYAINLIESDRRYRDVRLFSAAQSF